MKNQICFPVLKDAPVGLYKFSSVIAHTGDQWMFEDTSIEQCYGFSGCQKLSREVIPGDYFHGAWFILVAAFFIGLGRILK